MEQKKNIILTGFMGSGKTTLGLRLSYKLRIPVQDTDKLIEQREGRSISRIFAENGETYFREQETKLLQEIQERKYARIISVGGGTLVNPVNRELLKACGTVVYLRVQPETVYRRLKTDKTRPLLQCENPLVKITELLNARKDAYEECADIIIDVDAFTLDEVLEQLIHALCSQGHILQERCGSPGGDDGINEQYSNQSENDGKNEQCGNQSEDGGKNEQCGNQSEDGGINEDINKKEYRTKAENDRERVQQMKILVINGPNINFLGIREKTVYGNQDYQYLLDLIARKAQETGTDITVFQSNHEGGIIDRIQEAYFDGTNAIVINPGAYTHYSYAIRDALASITVPKVEIHISDITKREEFRKTSVTAPVCDRQIYGQGLDGYLQAIDFAIDTAFEIL